MRSGQRKSPPMTRILYWNLSKFSKNKIDAAGAGAPHALDRLAHILGNVFGANPPHIFVIVECHAGLQEVGFWGTLPSANVRAAVTKLLVDIRNWTGNPNWYVVPPACIGEVGFREGVAVFFDGTNLRFDGPYVRGPDYRTAGYTEPITRACPAMRTQRPHDAKATWPNGPQNYPAVWNTLPNRDTTIGDPVTGNRVPENQAAAQWEFSDIAGNALSFPNAWHRAPYLVRFRENVGAANVRTIKLLAIHTSPAAAAGGVRQIGSIAGLAPTGAHGVTVVLGDFNVDTISSIGTYQAIENAGFRMRINPRNGGAAAVPASEPYCQTHLLPTDKATPFNAVGVAAANPTHNPDPAYGYMGSMGGFLFRSTVYAAAIDNVFTWYATPADEPAAPNTTVVNTIVGAPYANLPGAVSASLTGAHNYVSALQTGIPAGGVQDNPPGSDVDRDRFRLWDNFGVIRDTSDHLPLMADI